MTERMLVPIDFSDASIAAARRAVEIAPALGARAELFHAVDATMLYSGWIETYVDAGALVTQTRGWAMDRLKRLVDEIDPAHAILSDVEVAAGRPVHAILDRAQSIGARWIVLGTQGRGALSRFLLGSVAERVVRHAPCDVIAVHPGGPAPVRRGRKILVGHDFSDDAAHALAEALRFARALELEIDLVHVVEAAAFEAPEGIAADTMAGLTRSAAASAQRALAETALGIDPDRSVVKSTRVIGGTPADALVEQAKAPEVGLVVVGSHGRTGLHRLMMGSVAERVVRTSPCDVLICRTRRFAERAPKSSYASPIFSSE